MFPNITINAVFLPCFHSSNINISAAPQAGAAALAGRFLELGVGGWVSFF